MAKINVYVPEPPKEYTEEGFRQINQAIATVENQLNTTYQQDLKNDQDAFNYFMSWQADANKTTVLTCPSDATIIVKAIYSSNNDASSAILVNMNLVDSSDSSTEYEFFRDDVAAKTQVNATPEGLNLEAGDSITVQASTGSNKIQGAITYALLDRSQENG